MAAIAAAAVGSSGTTNGSVMRCMCEARRASSTGVEQRPIAEPAHLPAADMAEHPGLLGGPTRLSQRHPPARVVARELIRARSGEPGTDLCGVIGDVQERAEPFRRAGRLVRYLELVDLQILAHVLMQPLGGAVWVRPDVAGVFVRGGELALDRGDRLDPVS